MKSILILIFVTTSLSHARGFSDADMIFYGEVRQVGGGAAVLLQAGELKITLVHPFDPGNVVTLKTSMKPTGAGLVKPFSYSIKVPLHYLPDAGQKSSALSVSAEAVDFAIQDITVNGEPATMPDGSLEFLPISFANRGSQYRLDLIFEGESEDLDLDELPDWWEELYVVSDPTADPDSDGWDNLTEFYKGSHPTTSNRETSLVTTEILIPESGQAGLFVQFFDSDTPLDEIDVDLSVLGFELLGDTSVTAADFTKGRLVLAHRGLEEGHLSLSWPGGSGEVALGVVRPVDASLWLDGHRLPEDGEKVDRWSDRSMHGRSAVQPSEEFRPIVRNRSLDFSDGAHLFFQDTALPDGDHTILAAYRAVEANETQTLFSSNRGHLKFGPFGHAISYPGAPRYQLDGHSVRGYEATSGRSIFRREGELLQNIYDQSYDGESRMVEAISPVLPTLGATRTASGSVDHVFQGELHEVIVFPTALPEQQLRDVSDYLDSKWHDVVLWDLSNEIRDLDLMASSQSNIMRGGLGDDRLTGGPLNDVISGGPGRDTLTGGEGGDQFVFGKIDTGFDRITDFSAEDVLDLSALFWGETGDARDYLATRLETNFETEIPTLDTVLIVDDSLEITLSNLVIEAETLIQLIMEGRIRMGALTIPTDLSLTSNEMAVIRENESFDLVLTRSGDGIPAALDVPLGFFKEAFGDDFEVEGRDGQRAVISFARGETTKIVPVRALPDSLVEGAEEWEMKLLPNFRYEISNVSVLQQVADFLGTGFDVWLATETSFANRGEVPADQLAEHIQQYIGDDFELNFRLEGGRPQFKLAGNTPDDIEWKISESETMKEWQEITGNFTREEAENLLTFLGAPRSGPRKFYRLSPELKKP